MMTYDDFKMKVAETLRASSNPLTWTEIRTTAALPQMFPNNQWVHRMERDIGLIRKRESDGTIHWHLSEELPLGQAEQSPPKAPDKVKTASGRKQGAVE
jgi:hypothetical protein